MGIYDQTLYSEKSVVCVGEGGDGRGERGDAVKKNGVKGGNYKTILHSKGGIKKIVGFMSFQPTPLSHNFGPLP